MEDTQENSDASEEKFTVCRTDISKALQLCKPICGSPNGKELYQTLDEFKNLFDTFEETCKSLSQNRFDFQLRQTVQSTRKELGVQLNIILARLDASSETYEFLNKAAPTPVDSHSSGIGSCVRNIASIASKLSEEAIAGDVPKFITLAKQVFALSKELQQILIQQHDENANVLAQKIGKLSMMVIRTAKELCQQSSDEIYHEFSLARQALSKQLQEVLFYDQGKSSVILTPPQSPETMRRSSLHRNVNEQNISNLKRIQETQISKDKSLEEEKKTLQEQQKRKARVRSSSHTTASETLPLKKEGSNTPKKSRKKKSRRNTTSQSGISRRIKNQSVKDVVSKLQDKPMFLLHKSQDNASCKPTNTGPTSPRNTTNISLTFSRNTNTNHTRRGESNAAAPLSGRRKHLSQVKWKTSLSLLDNGDSKLDGIMKILQEKHPTVVSVWNQLPKTSKDEMREQIDIHLLKTELEEHLQVNGNLGGTLGLVIKAVIPFVSQMYYCIENLEEPFLPDTEESLKSSFSVLISALCVTAGLCSSIHSPISPISQSTATKLQTFKDADFSAKNEFFVTAASQSTFCFHGPVKEMLSHQITGVYNLITQLLGIIRCSKTQGNTDQPLSITWLATLRSLTEALRMLILYFQTGKAIAMQKKAQLKGQILESEDLDELVDIDIWTETGEDNDTLNSIVRKLTKTHDTSFMKTVIYTHRSFTTSEHLLAKLIRRFEVPSSLGEKEGEAIQLRVCVVLKYWIQNQFNDFDTPLIEELKHFLDNIRTSGLSMMAEGIESQIRERMQEREERGEKVQMRPTNLRFPEVPVAPCDYFIQFPVDEIAKQMTMLDCNSLSNIQPYELMKQSWTNKKTQHQSVNVCWCMDRLNMISYWVPTVILSYPTLTERKKCVEWFYGLAFELRKLNNFQSLMAVVAGFNNASCQRLKYTFESIEKDLQKKYKILEELMSPQSSFKNYRSAIKKCHARSVPFLGVYLSDLVFIDEGNNDETVDGKINFEKRKLVYTIIQDLQIHQNLDLGFPVIQPLSQYLTWIPSLGDSQLYELSLLREPRGCSKEEIN